MGKLRYGAAVCALLAAGAASADPLSGRIAPVRRAAMHAIVQQVDERLFKAEVRKLRDQPEWRGFTAQAQPTAKVSALISATIPFSGSELFYLVQGGQSKKTTWSTLSSQALIQVFPAGNIGPWTVLTTGSDSNNCRLATPGGTGTGACRTIAHALGVMYLSSGGGVSLVLNLGVGTFNGAFLIAGYALGQGTANATGAGYTIPYVQLNGQGASTVIDSASTDTVACGTMTLTASAYVVLTNLTIQQNQAGACFSQGAASSAIFLQNQAYLAFGPGVHLGPTLGQHIHAEEDSVVEKTAEHWIDGPASSFEAVGTHSVIANDGYTVHCTGDWNFSTAFFFNEDYGIIQELPGTAYQGCQNATGPQFWLFTGGMIDGNGFYDVLSNIVIGGGSGTVTGLNLPAYPIGATVAVSGATPSSLNGAYVVTSSTASTPLAAGSFVGTTSATGTYASGGVATSQNAYFLSIPGSKTADIKNAQTIFYPPPNPTLTGCPSGTSLISTATDEDMIISFANSGTTCGVVYAIPKQEDSNCNANLSTGVGVGVAPSAAGATFNNTTYVNGSFLTVRCGPLNY